VLHDLADRSVTPTLANIFPESFAVAIREILVGALRHLLDGWQGAVYDCVTDPGLGEKVPRADRQVLRHSFHEPERGIDLTESLEIRSRFAAGEDVVLELVHHFVRQHVLEAAEVAGE